MSAANRNQNSGSQNSAGEDVPLRTITPTQTGDENSNNQGSKKGTDSTTATGDTKKNTNDNSGDQMYNPESAIGDSPLDNVSYQIPELFSGEFTERRKIPLKKCEKIEFLTEFLDAKAKLKSLIWKIFGPQWEMGA